MKVRQLVEGTELSPHMLAELSWGLARVEWLDQEVMAAIEARGQGLMTSGAASRLTAKDVVMVCWSMAQLRYRSQSWWACCRGVLPFFLPDILPHYLSLLLWSMATLDVRDAVLVSAITSRLQPHMPRCTPTTLAHIFWSLAIICPENIDFSLVDAINSQSLKSFSHDSLRQLALAWLLWARSPGCSTGGKGCRDLPSAALRCTEVDTGISRHALAASNRGGENVFMPPETLGGGLSGDLDLSPGLVDYALSVWRISVRHARPSSLQKDVCRIIHKVGYRAAMEEVIQGGLLSVDILVSLKPWAEQQGHINKSVGGHLQAELHLPSSTMAVCCEPLIVGTTEEVHVAIEVDGPCHFCRIPKEHPLGPTSARQRLLRQWLCHVTQITYWDWDELKGDDEKMEMIKGRLRPWLKSNSGAD